ncbi:MAG: class I SAM-dependent RNA methyltransferase, partial [Paracoccaceae bacterium]
MEQYRIQRLGHRGDGVAEGPVYAPLTLPGELVEAVRHGDRLDDIRVAEPSADRVRPPCRHFRSCGGCQLQHASDGFVADWKRASVVSALAMQGIEAEVLPPIASPPASRRRATFSARRTKKGALAGFHARASNVIVAVPDCLLLHPDLLGALPAVEALAVLGASRKGELNVTVTRTETGLDLAARGGKPLDGPMRLDLAQVCARHGLARLDWEGEVIAQARPPVVRFGRAEVVLPPGAFLQATPEGEATLLDEVRLIVGEASKVVDLFAGCGTFALPLAMRAEVHAVEGDTAMTAALDAGWRHAHGLKRVTTDARDLFRRPLLRDELSGFDAAVIDPPRAGAAAQIAELAKARVPRIAHVSCNPATFARDAAALIAADYRMGPVTVV